MDTLLVDFACSDSNLTQRWKAKVSAYDPYALASIVAQLIDDSSSETDPEPQNENLLTPLRSILGISAEEPGFTCVRIAPHPGDLLWAKGQIAISEGLVAVDWTRDEACFTLAVSIPVGVHLKTVLPAHPGDSLFVDDEPVNPDTQTIRTTRHVELAVLPGSNYRFEVVPGTIA